MHNKPLGFMGRLYIYKPTLQIRREIYNFLRIL